MAGKNTVKISDFKSGRCRMEGDKVVCQDEEKVDETEKTEETEKPEKTEKMPRSTGLKDTCDVLVDKVTNQKIRVCRKGEDVSAELLTGNFKRENAPED
jgi:hypothetical protein